MKFRTVATMACVGFLATSGAYADDNQMPDNQMLADNTATTSPAMPSADMAGQNSQKDTWTSNPSADDNVGTPDLSSQSAMNNVPPNPAELGQDNGDELSPDTATGDDM